MRKSNIDNGLDHLSSITREDVKDWFEKDVDSPYMTKIIKFKKEMRDKVQVVHFDGTRLHSNKE